MVQDAGKPRLVSVIAYLASSWALNEHAETLFLDAATDTGVCVRPRPGRVVLMDQDVMHRVCAPSLAAGRPRHATLPNLSVHCTYHCATATPQLPVAVRLNSWVLETCWVSRYRCITYSATVISGRAVQVLSGVEAGSAEAAVQRHCCKACATQRRISGAPHHRSGYQASPQARLPALC